jgi:hypothetical protein
MKNSIQDGGTTNKTDQIHGLAGVSKNVSAAYQTMCIRTRVHPLVYLALFHYPSPCPLISQRRVLE